MIIPYNKLSEDALQSLIDDFVTHNGSDYGHDEISRQEKAAQLLAVLKTDKMLISYDEETQSCGLVRKVKGG